MKASHFRKLRQQSYYYQVEHSRGHWGDFPFNWERSITVLARNPKEAISRALNRGYGIKKFTNPFGREIEKWAKWRVKHLTAPNHFKHIAYYY